MAGQFLEIGRGMARNLFKNECAVSEWGIIRNRLNNYQYIVIFWISDTYHHLDGHHK